LALLPRRGEESAELALEGLARRGVEVEASLLRLGREASPRQRAGAARVLGRLGSAAALALLERGLRDRRPQARRRAVRLLGCWSAHPAMILSHVERALQDAHGRVRGAAADVLAGLGPAAAPLVGLLLRRLHDGDRRVRAAARAAVDQLLPQLPEDARFWLALLSAPGHGPAATLRRALRQPCLPDGVRRAFRAMRRRRAVWRRSRGRPATADERQTEVAWLLAQLWVLLQPAPGQVEKGSGERPDERC
jgi:hypothetical protein